MFGLRRHFLLDPSVIFLNHGSFGATPRTVFRAYQDWGRELERQPVEFLGRNITDLLAGSRSSLGAYLGTAPDNLVYTQNVTISINIVARSLELGAGVGVLAGDGAKHVQGLGACGHGRTLTEEGKAPFTGGA